MESENERTVYTAHDAFPFSLFHLAKEAKRGKGIIFLFFAFLFMDWEKGKGC